MDDEVNAGENQTVVTFDLERKPGDWEKPETPHNPAGPVQRYCTINPDGTWADETVLASDGPTPACILAGICLDYLPFEWFRNDIYGVSVATKARVFQRWNTMTSIDPRRGYNQIILTSIFYLKGRFKDPTAAYRMPGGSVNRQCGRDLDLGATEWPGRATPGPAQTFHTDPFPTWDAKATLEMRYWLTIRDCGAGPPP
ncbi:hypothetical protein HFO71_10315 [Rhizobium laguerreae]|uniref:hypothetical protein n=1 Tax=Rhizobium laguerreae TaxID=1076926 RepID=UPI001C9272AA|nr:hypothetical protein [Rhizobium laguerreae]MBY3070734.1 hypothetical protein [Rhizobium laguerreae]